MADPRVVGWYQNARLYRECQSPPKGSNRVAPAVDGAYHATAKESDCKMLQPDARTLAVPRDRDVDGGMGRYVCYAEGSQHRGFLKRLFEFIESRGKGSEKRHGSGGQGWQTDPPRRKEVEDAAVREVIRYYRTLGYDIHDCQDEKCGWDLEASTTTA